MKRILNTGLLLSALAFFIATGVQAQDHQHQHTDTTEATPMEHMRAMMQMHERMMADPVIHEQMMADHELRAAMADMMGTEMDMAAMHERMSEMSLEEQPPRHRWVHLPTDMIEHKHKPASADSSPAPWVDLPTDMIEHKHRVRQERQDRMSRMHEGMMARLEAIPAEERQALMHRMMESHQRLMTNPIVRERMMADPEMHGMMKQMMQKGGMMHGEPDEHEHRHDHNHQHDRDDNDDHEEGHDHHHDH